MLTTTTPSTTESTPQPAIAVRPSKTHSATPAASLRKIINIARHDGIASPADAADVLRRADVKWEDLQPFADFDHDVRDGYGRRAVAVGENFELMIMSWAPGDFSAIHDHGNTQWGAVTYFGTAEHAIYDISGDLLRTNERTLMHTGEINAVDHDLVHQMGNPTDQPLMSLHLYGCREAVEGVTGDARIFNLLDGQIQTTDGGVFYCLPESKVNQTVAGMRGDTETTREHHLQMLARIDRIIEHHPHLRTAYELTASRLMNELLRIGAAAEAAA